MKKRQCVIGVIVALFFISCTYNENDNNFQLALAFYHEKQFEKSLENIEKIGFFDKSYKNGQFLKGKILYFQNNYKEAEDIFEKLVKENFCYESFIWQIRTLVLNNELNKAENLLLEEIKKGSTDWRVFYYVSKVYKKQNKTEESIVNLQYAEISLKEGQKIFDDFLVFWNEFHVLENVEKYKKKKEVLLR